MKKAKQSARLLSFLLTFVMLLGMLPGAAMAGEEPDGGPPAEGIVEELSPREEEAAAEPAKEPGSGTAEISPMAAPLAADPLLTKLTIRTGVTTADWSNALLAGEINTAGVAVFDPETKEYTLPAVLDHLTQLRFWYIKSADVKSVILSWGTEDGQSKVFSSGSNEWAYCVFPGKNTLKLSVVPNTGETVEYLFNLDVRPTLTALRLSANGSPLYLDKEFKNTEYSYAASIPDSLTELTVAATPNKSNYTLQYNGATSATVDISAASAVSIVASVGGVENTYIVALTKTAPVTYSATATPNDATVVIYDAKGAVLARGLGSATGESVLEGARYVATKSGYITQSGGLTAGTPAAVTLAAAAAPNPALPGYTGDWAYFRGNPENMGVTGAKTPATAESAVLKWAEKYGTGWAAAPTPPLILNDALYIAMNNVVIKIDKTTGKELARSSPLAGNVGYALNPITYGGGMFFVPITSGRVQALRADTLESLWVSESMGASAQSISPVMYHDGYVYTGMWNSGEDKEGVYYALSVTDEDPTAKTETKLCSWKLSHKGGFYWAGAYVSDHYLLVGSDDGSPQGEYTETAVFYSLHPKTGAVLDKIEGVKGDIRSSVSFVKNSGDEGGTAYFATKGGWFCTVKVDAEGKFVTDTFKKVAFTGMCTGTPLVHNNRAYIGSSGDNQFAPGKLNVIDLSGTDPVLAYAANLPGYPQASALLSSAYGDTAYVYITYNMTPGGIYLIKDKVGQTEAETADLFIPDQAQQQYSIASLVADKDGILYYKNDSCFLMAVAPNEAYLTGLTADKGKFDKTFAAGTAAYELVVPAGTQSVTLTTTSNEGAAVTINGAAPAAVALTGGKATATVVVTKGGDTRTYTVSIREAAADATLANAMVSFSNTFDANAPKLTFTGNPPTAISASTDANNFRRLWVKPSNEKAAIKVSAVSGVAASANSSALAEGTELPRVDVPNDKTYSRYNIYLAVDCAAATVKVTVTAEDATTKKDYFVTVTRPGIGKITFAVTPSGASIVVKDKNNAAVAAQPDGTYTLNVGEAYTYTATADGYVAKTGSFIPTKDETITLTLGADMPPVDELAGYRESARANLAKALEKYSEGDYTGENWAKLQGEYQKGIAAINAAKKSSGQFPEDNIIKALNAALAAMRAIPYERVGKIKVAVSVDANTLGLGYLIKPTLVTADKNARASVVLTELLAENGYRYDKTGTLESGFYLAGIKPVDQKNVKIADYILKAAGANNIMDSDRNDTTLEEFDYYNQSGWMYSVDNSFPGVGAADWSLGNGEVMRWQFTVYGLGADLNADNSKWGGASITNVGDKGDLTWAVATLRDQYTDAVLEANTTYQDAVKTLTDPEASQTKIDRAKTALDAVRFEADGATNTGTGGSSTEKNPFTDVKDGDWFFTGVRFVNEKGLFTGMSATTFGPNDKMTRAMLMTVLARLDGKDTAKGGKWDTVGLAWAKEASISDGANPEASVTRQEMVTMLYRYAKAGKATGDLTVFPDADQVSSWAADAMIWAVENGILKGTDTGKLNPTGTATRAEVATILMRFVERAAK